MGHPPKRVLALLGDASTPESVRLRAALGAEKPEAIWQLVETEFARRNGIGAAHAALLWLDTIARAGEDFSAGLTRTLERLSTLDADAALDLLSRYAPPDKDRDQVG